MKTKFVRSELPRESPFGPRRFRWFPVVGGTIDERGSGFDSKKAALLSVKAEKL